MPIMTCSAILSTDENTNGVFSAPVAVYEAEFRGPAIVFFRADSNEASEREVGARRGGPGCRRVLSLRADVGDLRLVEKFYVFVLYFIYDLMISGYTGIQYSTSSTKIILEDNYRH
jgi:hypothetical protein